MKTEFDREGNKSDALCFRKLVITFSVFPFELVLQFAAIITFCGVIVVPCKKVGVVTKHGVTASAGVTRADLTFAPSRKIES